MGKAMRSALLTLLAASLGCAGPLPFEPAGPEAAPDPALHGPYAVGVRTVDLRDATRPNAQTGEPRRLLTEVWYPAAEEARGQPGAVYTLADVLNPRAIATASITATVELGTEAVRDAAPYREGDGDGDAFPVVFFSHGSNGIRMQSLYLMTYLASHGYVVISPDHEGNVLSDLLTDNGIPDAGLAAGLFFLRADDVRFLMEHFRALPAGDSLAGLLDFTRVGVAGHSFGALTAVRVAGLSDPGHPVHMAIAQAPPKFGLSWLGVERPLSQVGRRADDPGRRARRHHAGGGRAHVLARGRAPRAWSSSWPPLGTSRSAICAAWTRSWSRRSWPPAWATRSTTAAAPTTSRPRRPTACSATTPSARSTTSCAAHPPPPTTSRKTP
jgi:hypothetical protein